jgi:hypothetical protein
LRYLFILFYRGLAAFAVVFSLSGGGGGKAGLSSREVMVHLDRT